MKVIRNIRILGSMEPFGPILEVDGIDIVQFREGKKRAMKYQVHRYEFFRLENGQRCDPADLIFVEANEDELEALRFEGGLLRNVPKDVRPKGW